MGSWGDLSPTIVILSAQFALAQEVKRPAVPAKAQLVAASRQIDELRSRTDRTYGPTALLDLARQTTSSPALRYAAASRAMEAAAASGDIVTASKALDDLYTNFAVERCGLQLDLLKSLAASPRRGAAAILAMRWINDAYVAGQLATAGQFAGVIRECSGDLSESLQAAAGRHLADFAAAKQAAENLVLNPAAPLYRALYQQQWEENLASLANGESPIAELARQDKSAADHGQQMAAADAWWQHAQKLEGIHGWRVAGRSVQIYTRLLQRADGVERELVAARIAQHQRQLLLEQGYQPGPTRDIWHGKDKDRRCSVADTLDLPRDAAEADLPKSDAHVLYTGQLLIETPGRYEFNLIGGSALRVAIDGVTQIDNPTAYNKRSGIKLPMELSAGLHPFEIEVTAKSSAPRLAVQWLTPAMHERQPIPAGSIFHDTLLLQ